MKMGAWGDSEKLQDYKNSKIIIFVRHLLPPKANPIVLSLRRFSRASDKNNQKLIWAQMTQKKSLTMKSYHNNKTNEQTYSIIS